MRLVASFTLLLFLAFSLTAPAEAQECCSYSIEGFVFADLNADGIMNGADYGLVGWTVEAFNLTTGTAFASVVTGPGGYYLFPPSAVLPCTSPYGLREVVQSPWIQTSPTNPNFLTLSLGACDNSVFGPFNFGNCGDAYKLYTLDADFNQGNLNGLITNSDQLEISPTPTTFGFGWIANADEGTISKIDMATGNELARYYTGPPDAAGKYAYLYPSRTVVDEDGNCWVANRTGSGRLPSVTQILANGAIDLNGDNQLTTSGDCCPADGQITLGTAEILPWGQDEAVVRHYQIGTTVNNFARGLAIDKGGFLWVGLSSDLRIAKLRTDHPTAIYGSHQPQTTVPEEASVPLCTQPNSCQIPYGIALSPNGFLYVSTIGSLAFEIDPGLNSGGTAAGPAVTQNYINHGPDRNYGIAVDQDCIVWLAKYGGSPGSTDGCIRWDPTVGVNNPALGFTNSVGTTQGGGRGITVDFNGDIWMATNDTDGVTKFNNANPPVVLGNYGTAITRPTGVGAASDGNMILTGQLSSNWEKRNVTTGANIPLAGPQLVGYHPYTYSDFTGSLFQLTNKQQGLWTVTTDGGFPSLTWTIINWNESTPPGTGVSVEARSAASQSGLALQPWRKITTKGNQLPPFPGRFIETRVRMHRDALCGQPFVTPVLFDLEVEAVCGGCIIVCPPDTSVICDSPAGKVVNYTTPYVASDCDSTWVLTCTPASGSLFPIGTTTVQCQAINATNDTIDCSFNVYVGGDCLPTPMGACCINNNCTVTTEADCEIRGGIYYGDGSDCTTGCNYLCLRPPSALTAWFPFDGPLSGTTPNLADASGGGVLVGPPTQVPGNYVNNAYNFPGALTTFINVPHTKNLNLGTGDFSMDVWVNTVAVGRNPIVDKRAGSGVPLQGVYFFLQNGYPGLQLSFFGTGGDFVLGPGNGGPAAFVGDGQWHLVAVTVDRDDPNGIQFYVDGIPVGSTFDPTPFSATLNTTVDMQIAKSYGHFQPEESFEGSLDELEIFKRELTLDEIDFLYAAGDAGKCREACYATDYTPCCDNQAASASFTICNYDGVAHTYSWGASALAPALGCSPGGASSFLPSSGTLTVPAQSCVTVPIDIACPTGINAGSLSCWQVSVYNHDTGNLFGCRGSVRRPLWWCPKVTVGSGDVVSTPVLVSPTSSGRNVTIEVQHIGLEPAPGGDVSIQILALDGDGKKNDLVSLDGLPPGEPIIRQVTPGSDDELLIDFVVDYVENQPIGLDRIELLIDDDMDGDVEPVAMFFTQGSEAATVGLDDRELNPDGDGSVRPFLTLPNPFSSSGLIRFQVQGESAKKVTLGLYDLSGRRIKIFHRKDLLEPGIHSVDWDGTDGRGQRLASGVYFLRLDADEFQETVKVVLMK